VSDAPSAGVFDYIGAQDELRITTGRKQAGCQGPANQQAAGSRQQTADSGQLTAGSSRQSGSLEAVR
jgi:hypothetical protein